MKNYQPRSLMRENDAGGFFYVRKSGGGNLQAVNWGTSRGLPIASSDSR